jgi:hypothetical protein
VTESCREDALSAGKAARTAHLRAAAMRPGGFELNLHARMHVVFLILKLLFLILKSRIAVLPKPKHSGESDKACSQRQVPDRESELSLPLERLYFFSIRPEEAAAFA